MLGWEFTQTFKRLSLPHPVVAADLPELDITDHNQVRDEVRRLRPDVIINAAAYTNVDGAEKDRELAHQANVVGPSILAEISAECGCRLVHFGTDQVFDGAASTPRVETDPTGPLNYYATTKLEGERAVLRQGNTLVLRLQWLYGERKDRFTALRSHAQFTPFSDQYGAPTWTRDVADVVIELLVRRTEGLFHFTYDDYASWLDVFEFVRRELHLNVKLIPRKTSEVSLPARRPLFSVMSNRKLLEALELDSLGSWKSSLREFLGRVADRGSTVKEK